MSLHTYFSFYFQVRILLRKFGLWCWDDDLEHKEYDVFVSFSHQDELYVMQELVPRLESGRNKLRLCLHYRDWVVGDYIPSQIARSVEQSRKTLIVLSEHFARSDWAQMEFRAAHGRERLLVLVLGALEERNLHPDLRAYISTNTYIKADDPLVIDRLKDAVLSKTPAFMRERKDKKAQKTDKPVMLDVHLNKDGKLVNNAVTVTCDT